MQKHANLVDLVKSFPTNIFLQNLASIQQRMGLTKFAHLAEKSEKGSISNLSTKVLREPRPDQGRALRRLPGAARVPLRRAARGPRAAGCGPVVPGPAPRCGPVLTALSLSARGARSRCVSRVLH